VLRNGYSIYRERMVLQVSSVVLWRIAIEITKYIY